MRNFNILSQLLLAVLWAGLLLGVSFLATPVKFLAPSLSLPVALDVGGTPSGCLTGLRSHWRCCLSHSRLRRLRYT